MSDFTPGPWTIVRNTESDAEVTIRRFAARVGASSSTCYPVIRQRDGAILKWYVRNRGFLDVDGEPL